MNKITLLFTLVTFLLPGYTHAATSRDIHIEWSYSEPNDGHTLAGYNLYMEGVKVCTQNNPSATSLDCVVQADDRTYNFTLTSFFTDNSETEHSDNYLFTFSSKTEPPPVAAITTTPLSLSGDTPFNVTFDSSGSTGDITSYTWSFEDNQTSTQPSPSHTFTRAGIYTTTLTVTSAQGITDQATVTIVANTPTPENSAPNAVISTSTAVGEAPFAVSFNGTGSNDKEGAITSYRWSFGDGTTAKAANTSHTYSVPGTYSASLTVLDEQGASDVVSTPIIIIESTTVNEAPTARITASTATGSIPLKISFSGTTSSDPENGPLSYAWNFEDGSTAQGVSATHSFTTAGSHQVTLTVTDNGGASSTATFSITAKASEPVFHIELDDIEINHNWARVDFEEPFVDPVVVAGPLSFNDGDPSVIRLRNITSTGFEIRVQEWNYLDGSHAFEKATYLVIEKGVHTLENGIQIEAGIITVDGKATKSVPFTSAFATEPVVITSVATFNDPNAVTHSIKDLSNVDFSVSLTEEEKSTHTHGEERISFIALEEINMTFGNLKVIVGKVSKSVTHKWYTLQFGKQLQEEPFILTTMSPQRGRDTASLRYQNRNQSSVEIKVEEEQSKDREIIHSREAFGYLLFSISTP